MGLFNKTQKKLTLDEILEGINNLSDEDKAKVKDKMQDLYKAEDEREIDKIEEDKAEDAETKDEKGEEVTEESEEIGKDVDEVEDEVETDEVETDETPVEDVAPEVADEPEEEVVEEPEVTEDFDKEDVARHEAEEKDTMDALMKRFQTLEEEHAELAKKYDELYSLLEDRENNAKFGVTPEASDEEAEERKDNSVYRAYAGSNAHKYY